MTWDIRKITRSAYPRNGNVGRATQYASWWIYRDGVFVMQCSTKREATEYVTSQASIRPLKLSPIRARMNADAFDNVRQWLARYDALSNWTMTESRYIEVHTAYSATRARELVRLVRKAAKARQVRT